MANRLLTLEELDQIASNAWRDVCSQMGEALYNDSAIDPITKDRICCDWNELSEEDRSCWVKRALRDG